MRIDEQHLVSGKKVCAASPQIALFTSFISNKTGKRARVFCQQFFKQTVRKNTGAFFKSALPAIFLNSQPTLKKSISLNCDRLTHAAFVLAANPADKK